uniref:Uncharacterized protein n=1 Tax=Anopheles minimus TaxID=112268 RepID=A0A182WMT6_9DIPT
MQAVGHGYDVQIATGRYYGWHYEPLLVLDQCLAPNTVPDVLDDRMHFPTGFTRRILRTVRYFLQQLHVDTLDDAGRLIV